MGRRKIEIKAIKDDRNRSVTFLKRKGGLFKKAHELAVLCSVDVAVIIFGHNKKLYEFSSGNINETLNRYSYVCQTYGGPHEHKGPEDFNGKKDAGSDEEDEEPGSPRPDSHSPPHSLMQHHLQHQPAFQHLGTPSASPPMQNGGFHHRNASPGPQHISRPGSRTHIRHPSTHLVPPPPHHLHPSQSPQPPQGSFAYMPNPPIYNPQAAAVMQVRSVPGQPQPPQIHYPQAPQHQPPPPQQFHPPPHPQLQQVQAQEQRRQSMPPAIPAPQEQPPQPPAPMQSPPVPQQQQHFSPPMPQPKPLSTAAKTHSIFTPIDDSRSLLAQHWGSSTIMDDPKSDTPPKAAAAPRSQSIDVASISREETNGVGPRPPPKISTAAPTSNPAPPQRTFSTPVINHVPPQPPSRTNSLGIGRPRLKVQIPDEHSDSESAKPSGDSSPRATVAGATLTPVREHGAVHLPPPSPSASALLSAGATGPPNPFARPPPPTSTNGFGSRGDLDTPISALPSRFVSDQLLPSPSGFYNDWGFGRDSNMLPSPLTFPTPVVGVGPSFRDDPDLDKKRKISEGSENSGEKRIKT